MSLKIGHVVPLGISHRGPGGTKTSHGSGASLFLCQGLSFPAERAEAKTFPGKAMPRTPRHLLEKPRALPGSGRQECGCVRGSLCSLDFILALCGANGQRAWPGLRSGLAKEWEL